MGRVFEQKWKKRDKNICLVQLKMIETIKRFKRSKQWKLLGCRYLDFSFGHNGYKRWFACFVAKKGKYRSFVVIWKYQGNALMFYFASLTCSVERIHRTVASSRRPHGVAERPSKSWLNFNRWPPRTQNLGQCNLFLPWLHVARRDAFGHLGEDG